MDFFNQSVTRLAITSFMDFFAKFSIEKYTTITSSASSGDVVFAQRKIIPVPIQWAAREKWVEIVRSSSSRKAMDPNIRDKNPVEMMWILPRISCNLNGVTYDPNRRLIKTQKVTDSINTAISTNNSAYSPASYNLDLEISTIARHIDDNLQLMEQIIPYFSPAMSLNLNLYGNEDSESVPVILNSISVDIPTDIPEFEERIFTNVYSFTMKLNYYMIRQLKNVITTIDTNLINGNQVVSINKKWIVLQNKITDRYNEYVLNATRTNPLVVQQDLLSSNAISALGHDPFTSYLDSGNNKLYLYTPSLSASEYQNLFYIYYRKDSNTTVYKYDTTGIDVDCTRLVFWLEYSANKIDASQLQVYTFSGAIGSTIVEVQ